MNYFVYTFIFLFILENFYCFVKCKKYIFDRETQLSACDLVKMHNGFNSYSIPLLQD